MLVKVYVTPKQGVLDPQGKAVAHGLHTLGYDEVEDVRIGKLMLVRVREDDPARAAERVREMCERLLANLVIEDYQLEVLESESDLA